MNGLCRDACSDCCFRERKKRERETDDRVNGDIIIVFMWVGTWHV